MLKLLENCKATSGDSLSNDDVFGAISGAILNPNTELLFSGVDMRNFQLNFKLVPRDAEEAAMCNAIVDTSRKHHYQIEFQKKSLVMLKVV